MSRMSKILKPLLETLNSSSAVFKKYYMDKREIWGKKAIDSRDYLNHKLNQTANSAREGFNSPKGTLIFTGAVGSTISGIAAGKYTYSLNSSGLAKKLEQLELLVYENSLEQKRIIAEKKAHKNTIDNLKEEIRYVSEQSRDRQHNLHVCGRDILAYKEAMAKSYCLFRAEVALNNTVVPDDKQIQRKIP